MEFNLIYESHVEGIESFLMNMRVYLGLSLSNYSFDRVNKSLPRFFDELTEEVKILGEYVKFFYSGVNISPGNQNILFIDGNHDESFGKKFLINRGLDPGLFSKIAWLDREGALRNADEITIVNGEVVLDIDDMGEREEHWVKVINRELEGVSDVSIYLITGVDHLRPESIVNTQNLSTSLNQGDLVINEYVMERRFIDELEEKINEFTNKFKTGEY